MSLQSLQLATYGNYVWSCYGLTLIALVGLALYSRGQWRAALRDAQRRAIVHASAPKTP